MAAAGKNVDKQKSGDLAKAQARAERQEAHKDAPNPVWFKPVMFGFMLLGLIWIVLYYVTSSMITPLPLPMLGQANIFVGFGLVLVGFLMTPWWK
ncbi:hypothetical protein JOF28_001806 [Leucobacter exalbidus]|uniref:Cell division protein CrgA n=1 Tax=Leucobacter exalbidus TaxID=662960 RepID=A0A940PWF7_9MICO|nr:cell division protein CrgA [Leucobacter exalbidus]MBP1326574.1 hypothetical protein [Leucobacter exalbidus]